LITIKREGKHREEVGFESDDEGAFEGAVVKVMFNVTLLLLMFERKG
jgi:hypothetical protein